MSGSNGSGAKIALAVVLTLAVCGATYQFYLKELNAGGGNAVANSGIEDADDEGTEESPQPTVLREATHDIPGEKGWKQWDFKLTKQAEVSCVVKGVANAENGFDCYVIPKKDLSDFKPGKPVNMVEGFKGVGVKVYNRRAVMKAGEYALVVVNSKNKQESMKVMATVMQLP
ncbi:MAG: hypothetical protein ACYTDT_10180 [Planctomycetota bacterium]|jgi:hypothetical protein